MLASRIARASHKHTPLIHFIGKRQPHEVDHTPKPHPAAPDQALPSSGSGAGYGSSPTSSPPTSQSSQSTSPSSSPSSNPANSLDFLDLPARFRPERSAPTEEEIEAIMTGGASKVFDQWNAAFRKPIG